jgi:FixJ family two-component response regulator
MTKGSESEPVIFVIDDDASVRNSLCNLFRSVGLRTEVFESARELLLSKLPDVASCMVLDIRLPGVSGLDFQTELVRANIHIPIIFMTGHGDIPMTVRAMEAGAIDFLTKPFRDQDMLDAVAAAGMSGVELQILLIAQGSFVPMIFITAYPEDSIRSRAMKAGAICFLSKPFDGLRMIECIRTALKRHDDDDGNCRT